MIHGGIAQLISKYEFKRNGEGQLIPLSEQGVAKAVEEGGFYVAVSEGRIVGSNSVVEYGGIAEMRSWAIMPGHQGKGIGTKLAEAAIREAAERGHAKLYTLTQRQNAALLERLGFKKVETPPEKLARDCRQCPIADRCNEEAYAITLAEHRELYS